MGVRLSMRYEKGIKKREQSKNTNNKIQTMKIQKNSSRIIKEKEKKREPIIG